jgi:hypothetical protein
MKQPHVGIIPELKWVRQMNASLGRLFFNTFRNVNTANSSVKGTQLFPTSLT